MDEIKRGSNILVRHPLGSLLSYRVVEEIETEFLRLLNTRSYYLMYNFKTKNPEKIRKYIEEKLKCEIIKVE